MNHTMRSSADDDAASDDVFVPDPKVWVELGISSMTGWRWQRDRTLNFPPAIRIRGRNFRSRAACFRGARLKFDAIALGCPIGCFDSAVLEPEEI
jgi:hypothetical protein